MRSPPIKKFSGMSELLRDIKEIIKMRL